jgi:periplasmic divalent cation tolerance protein
VTEADGHVVCLVTSPPERAGEIARALVEERLAACVNVVGGVRSVYRWEGDVHADDESLLVVKTTAAAVPAVEDALRRLHPYENFELVALDVAAGAPAYLSWIGESVTVGD